MKNNPFLGYGLLRAWKALLQSKKIVTGGPMLPLCIDVNKTKTAESSAINSAAYVSSCHDLDTVLETSSQYKLSINLTPIPTTLFPTEPSVNSTGSR